MILNDPAGVTGRRRCKLDYEVSLQQNIERHLSGGADAELRINGQRVDPLTDPRLDLPPGKFDSVVIMLRPRGFDPITWAYIAFAVSFVAALALRPSMPSVDSAAGKDSPNNKLTGQTNVARAYQGIPDNYGYRRVWPDLIQPSTVEYVAQVKYVTEWLCISRGIGTITSVQYAETPIADIEGSSFEVFEPLPAAGVYPELGETTLADVFEAFASDEVNGQELPYVIPFAPLSKTGDFVAVLGESTFTVALPDGADLAELKSLVSSGSAHVVFSYGSGPTLFDEICTVDDVLIAGATATFTFGSSVWDADQSLTVDLTITPLGEHTTTTGPFTLPIDGGQIWWNTVFLRGLRGGVSIRAEWWQINSGGGEVPGTRQQQDNIYTDSTYDQRFYTTKVTPVGGVGRYRIQFTRLNAQVDSNGADVAKLEEVYAVRHFDTKVLPGVTVLRVTTKATLSAIGFSDRKFNLRWLRHVRTLTDNTLSESRNFARTMAHIWTIAGNDIAGLDTDALTDLNDALGEDSPLLRFDGSLDDADMSLGERLQFVADMARCAVWRDGTRWTITRDQLRFVPEVQFDYRNLAADGQSAIAYAAHLPASNDGVELEYVDEATQSKKAYSRLNISTGDPVVGPSSNPKKVRMLGCATREQADNRAELEARRLIYQRSSVSDTALQDGAMVGLGALVRWIDPNDFGGDDLQAGEVIAFDASGVMTPSEPLDFKGQSSGRILFTGEQGVNIGPPIICLPLTATTVQLAIVPAGLYVADADRQCGSRYAFAVGLTDTELELAGLYIVNEIQPASDGRVSLALLAYDRRMYPESFTPEGALIDVPGWSYLTDENGVPLVDESGNYLLGA